MKADIFELLKQNRPESGRPESGLPTLSLWQKAIHYVMFFTTHAEQFASHYDQDKKVQYLCLGADCLACAADVKATEHIYMPTWDVQNSRVAALKFDTRPEGPARKILPFLASYRDQLSEIVAVFDCKGKDGEFTITAHRRLPTTDAGALECKAFCEGLETGTIDLRDCVKRLSADEMAELPSVNVKQVPVPALGGVVVPGSPTGSEASAPIGEPVAPNANGGSV